jgi:hypothetical protein
MRLLTRRKVGLSAAPCCRLPAGRLCRLSTRLQVDLLAWLRLQLGRCLPGLLAVALAAACHDFCLLIRHTAAAAAAAAAASSQ